MDRRCQPRLLQLAMDAVSRAARGEAPQPQSRHEDEATGVKERGGAFVTLHDPGGVRGCVGTTDFSRPLVWVVQEMAIAAATRDPRFCAVAPKELPSLRLEISVLSQPEPITDLESVRIGRDGLSVEGRGRKGLLLPQVAAQRDWDAERFARRTCEKAGLEEQAYLEEDVQLFRFGAEVFGSAA